MTTFGKRGAAVQAVPQRVTTDSAAPELMSPLAAYRARRTAFAAVIGAAALIGVVALGKSTLPHLIGGPSPRPMLTTFGNISSIPDTNKITYMRVRLYYKFVVCNDPRADRQLQLLQKDNLLFSDGAKHVYGLALRDRKHVDAEYCAATLPKMWNEFLEWVAYSNEHKLVKHRFSFIIGEEKMVHDQLDRILDVTRIATPR